MSDVPHWEESLSLFVSHICSKANLCREAITHTVDGRWDTLLNYVLRVRISGAIEECYFVKIPNGKQSLESEFTRTRELHGIFAIAPPRFGCVEPIYFSDDPQALVVRECKGSSLQDLIATNASRFGSSGKEELPRAMNSVGKWLHLLEKNSAEPAGAVSAHEKLLEEATLCRKQVIRSTSDHATQRLANDCLRIMEVSIRDLPEGPTYLAHGDLHAENLILGEGQHPSVHAIDCGLVDRRILGYDALQFEFFLRYTRRPPRYNGTTIRRGIAAFLDGYAPDHKIPIEVDRSLQAYFILKALRHLNTEHVKSPLKRFSERLDLTWLSKLSKRI